MTRLTDKTKDLMNDALDAIQVIHSRAENALKEGELIDAGQVIAQAKKAAHNMKQADRLIDAIQIIYED